MSDDAEFDAFLKGEGELSRRLQAMPQAEPSAELDAAILNRARLAMAQETHPAAANDPGSAPATPRLAPSFGHRWRVPMGIAATLLAGVFANQAFQQQSKLEEPVVADMVAPAPVLIAPAEELAQKPAMLAPPPPQPKADREIANFARSAAPAPEPAVEAKSAPPPPPPRPEAMAAAPAAPAPAPVVAATVPAPAAPAPVAAATAPALAQDARGRSQALGGLAADADKRKAAPPEVLERVAVTGSRIKPADSKSWLAEIERLLKEGENEQALHEWQRFREAYPREKVAPELEARLDALDK